MDPLRAHWGLVSAAPAVLRGGVLTELDLSHGLQFLLASSTDLTGVFASFGSGVFLVWVVVDLEHADPRPLRLVVRQVSNENFTMGPK